MNIEITLDFCGGSYIRCHQSLTGCVNFALKRLANHQKNKYSTDVVIFLCRHVYVDVDLYTYSVGTFQEAIQFVDAASELCTI